MRVHRSLCLMLTLSVACAEVERGPTTSGDRAVSATGGEVGGAGGEGAATAAGGAGGGVAGGAGAGGSKPNLKPCEVNEDCPVRWSTCQMGYCCIGTMVDGECRCGAEAGCDLFEGCCELKGTDGKQCTRHLALCQPMP